MTTDDKMFTPIQALDVMARFSAQQKADWDRDDKAKAVHAAEVARQELPDKKCPSCKTQIVKLGSLCPACGKKVK